MIIRHVKVTRFALCTHPMEIPPYMLIRYLEATKSFIQSLAIYSCSVAFHHVLIHAALFPHLQSVEYHCRHEDDYGRLLALLLNNKNLTDLKIECQSSHHIEDVFKDVSLPHLTTLSCPMHKSFLHLFSESLLRLDAATEMSFTIQDNVIQGAAKCCPRLRTLCCQSVFLPAFMDNCPEIVNLCVRVTNGDCVTDETVLQIVQKLRFLRALNLCNDNSRVTPLALEHIVSHISSTLEVLRLFMSGCTVPPIDLLRSKLPKLHSLLWVSCYRTLRCAVVVKNNHVTVEAPASADMFYFANLSKLKRIDILILAFPVHQYQICRMVGKPDLKAFIRRYPGLQAVCQNDQCVYNNSLLADVHCSSMLDSVAWMQLPV